MFGKSRPTWGDQVKGSLRAIRKGGFSASMSPLAMYRESKQVMRERLAKEETQRRRAQGGTMNSTAFKDEPKKKDPRKREIQFNAGKVDGDRHGHVVESRDQQGDPTHHYVRDVEANVYRDEARARRPWMSKRRTKARRSREGSSLALQ